MNNTTILSSGSESSFLDESLLHPKSENRADRNVKQGENNLEIGLKKELFEKYPILFTETMKILSKRCSNQELRKLALEYQKLYEKLYQQERRSKLEEHKPQKQDQKTQKIDIIRKHKKITDQIDSITQKRSQILDQIQEKNRQKLSNRCKLKLLTKIIKQATQNEENNPYLKIDQQYLRQIVSVLKQYENDLEKSKLGIKSQDPGQANLPQGIQQQARRNRIKQQIIKLQTQKQTFKAMTQKQQIMIQRLKLKIKQSQESQSQIYKQLKIQGDVTLKRNIIGDLVQTFITKHMKEAQFDYGLDKTVDEYVENIDQLKNQTVILKQQFRQQQSLNAQKQNVCILLEKKLAGFKKEKKNLINTLLKEIQPQEQINTKEMNNQQMILKAYHFEGNKIQSEISQLEAKHKTQQVSMFLEEQTKNYLQSNQKVSVKNYQSKGWLEKLFRTRNSKQKLNLILIIWLILLIFLFSFAFLTRYEYIPKFQLVKTPRTVIHRYQGRTRIVDGQVVNISHFDESSADKLRQKQNIQNYSSQQEVIIIEPVPEHPKKTWVDILKMEYK